MNIPQSILEPFEPHGIPQLQSPVGDVESVLTRIYNELQAFAKNKTLREYPVGHFTATFKFGISISAIPKMVKSWSFSTGGRKSPGRRSPGRTIATRVIVDYTLHTGTSHTREFFVCPGEFPYGDVW